MQYFALPNPPVFVHCLIPTGVEEKPCEDTSDVTERALAWASARVAPTTQVIVHGASGAHTIVVDLAIETRAMHSVKVVD